jgi:hypothetical protein
MAVVALFVFSLLRLTPGDPAAVIASDYASLQDVQRIRQKRCIPSPSGCRCSRCRAKPGQDILDARAERSRPCLFTSEAPALAPQRITSLAWKRSIGGSVRSSAWAVFRLMTSSNLMGCSTGRSAGLAPLRILST